MHNNTHSLTGKETIHPHHLSGKAFAFRDDHSEAQRLLKRRICQKLLLPLVSKQWDQFRKNLFLADQFRAKLDGLPGSEDLSIYRELLQLFHVIHEQHTQLEDWEKRSKTTTSSASSNASLNLISMVYRTTFVKLRPEYELYDQILGKPSRLKGETYREDILTTIDRLMRAPDADYDKVERGVLHML